jgi:hypothetical protein
MLADPRLRIAQAIGDPQHFEVPFLAGFEAPFGRMRWHQKKSEFHSLLLSTGAIRTRVAG